MTGQPQQPCTNDCDVNDCYYCHNKEQPQYIITEELVKDVENGFKYGVEGTMPTSNELVDALRSHPFQSERDKNVFSGEPALTEIEIALRKEESPSENIQWAIERLNQVQGYLEEAMTLCIVAERASERDKVLDGLIQKSHITTNTDYFEGKKVVLVSDIEKLRQQAGDQE